MNKVYFKKAELDSIVLSNLQNAVNELESARSISEGLDIPDFEYSSDLANLSSKILGYISECVNVDEWIERSISNYDRFINESVSDLNSFVSKEVDVKVEHANALY